MSSLQLSENDLFKMDNKIETEFDNRKVSSPAECTYVDKPEFVTFPVLTEPISSTSSSLIQESKTDNILVKQEVFGHLEQRSTDLNSTDEDKKTIKAIINENTTSLTLNDEINLSKLDPENKINDCDDMTKNCLFTSELVQVKQEKYLNQNKTELVKNEKELFDSKPCSSNSSNLAENLQFKQESESNLNNIADFKSVQHEEVLKFDYKPEELEDVNKTLLYDSLGVQIDGSFPCGQCSYKAVLKSKLNRHIRAKHTKQYLCNYDDCDFHTAYLSALKRHTNSKHTKEDIYKCDICTYETTHAAHLKSHINGRHTKQKMYKCDFCTYETGELHIYKVHVNGKHTKQSLRKCHYCDYETGYPTALKNHMITKHTGENMHECEFCSYKSACANRLKVHVNAMHTHENMHQCEHCDYQTGQIHNLNLHVRAKHTKQNMNKCDFCNYETARVDHLKVHVNAKHTKQKMYKCYYCQYETARISSVAKHVNAMHTKLNMFDCEHCAYKTPRKSNLRSHIKSKHTKRTKGVTEVKKEIGM